MQEEKVWQYSFFYYTIILKNQTVLQEIKKSSLTGKKEISNQPTIYIQTLVEQQDNSIKDLLQIVEEQYRQLNQQQSQIKEIENQVSQYLNSMSNLLHKNKVYENMDPKIIYNNYSWIMNKRITSA